MLGRQWRMMGAMEAVDGVMLFGITTAFLFAVMQVWWPIYKLRVFGVGDVGTNP
jgi:hypothetical protein